MSVGIRLSGHAAAHLPQRMQSRSFFTLDASSAKARMALFCLRTGISVLITGKSHHRAACYYLSGSALKPPQKSIISPTFMPMGTRTFLGSAIAEPSTVSERLTSGLPDLRYLAINATEATFITTQPTSAGSFPGGTFRPVAE